MKRAWKTATRIARVLLFVFLGAVALEMLLPAKAHAQLVASGVPTVAQVLARLVGQTVVAERYRATAATGTGFACDAALTTCLDSGPGANNGIGTDGTALQLATGAGTGIVNIGEAAQIILAENGNFTNSNGAMILNGTTFLVNQTANRPVLVDSANGFKVQPKTLPTCAAAIEWAIVADVASGVSTAARSRLCVCTSDGAAAYAWQNVVTGTVDTATTCAP